VKVPRRTIERRLSKASIKIGEPAMVAARLGMKPTLLFRASRTGREAVGAESSVWIGKAVIVDLLEKGAATKFARPSPALDSLRGSRGRARRTRTVVSACRPPVHVRLVRSASCSSTGDASAARASSKLALDAGMSQRHLSFVETGRSKPSREMVLLIARALDVPLRERNALLLAAGFAPVFRESALDAPALAQARKAIEFILRQQEPYPAVVMNRRWDVLETNTAAQRLFTALLGERATSAPANVLRMMFAPDALRPHVANWEAVAETLVQRTHREAIGGAPDADTARLLDEVLALPGVPQRWRLPDLESETAPLIPVEFRLGARVLRFFSTVTTLGTPQDITLQELRIECFFPADEQTERRALSPVG
jgi:transcriptional regulator with XRE-family HTH domain